MSRKLISIIAGAAAAIALLAAGAGYFLLSPSHAATAAVNPADHMLGSPKAPVTVIEYGAPSCPVCARFNAEVISQLKKDYIDKGKVLYVFRVWPLRPSDGAAEKIARCLPPAKYFTFLDLLFRNQRLWDEEFGVTNSYAGLVRVAGFMGLPPARVDQCIGDEAQDSDINRVAAVGEARYNITATPTLVVNGAAQPSGSLNWEQMKALVDAALARK